jgi:hypothetical protein
MAISIFAIVITLAYGSYRSTFRVIDQTEAQTEIYNQATIAMNRINCDLGSLFPGDSGFLLGTAQTIGNKEADVIQFTSTAHLVLNREEQPAGYATISYTVEEDSESGTLSLYRHDQAFRPAETAETSESKGALLCGGLQEVRFLYYDNKGDQKDSWDSKAIMEADTKARKFPDKIEISLLFADPAAGSAPVRFTTAATFPSPDPANSTSDSGEDTQ